MINEGFLTPFDTAQKVSELARAKRLSLNLSQKTLSEKSGVSYGVIKKFELTGKISLESLLKIAWSLGCLEGFFGLFKVEESMESLTIDDLMKLGKKRKRCRK